LKIRKHGVSIVPDTAEFVACVSQVGGSAQMSQAFRRCSGRVILYAIVASSCVR